MLKFNSLISMFGLLILFSAPASAVTIIVNAQADIFLAGQTAIPSFPGGAGQLPPSLPVVAGQTLNITATGLINCCFTDPLFFNGPDGRPVPLHLLGYGNVGEYLSATAALPLVGVFGGATLTTPWSIIIIGSASVLTAPLGATDLYFGIADGFNGGSPQFYGDNTGAFTVTVSQTPLPAALPLFATVLAGGGLIAWRRKRKAAKAAA